MYGRFKQLGTRRYNSEKLGADVSDHRQWTGGAYIASHNIALASTHG